MAMRSALRLCGIYGCQTASELQHPICVSHQAALPRDHLDVIYRAFNRHAEEQSRGFMNACYNATSYLRTVLGAEESGRQRKSWDALVAYVRAKDEARAALRPPRTPKPGTRRTSTGVQLKLV